MSPFRSYAIQPWCDQEGLFSVLCRVFVNARLLPERRSRTTMSPARPNAIFLPSGDQLGPRTELLSPLCGRVSLLCPVPLLRTMQSAVLLLPAGQTKARRRPSGDQAGAARGYAPRASRTGSVESRFII